MAADSGKATPRKTPATVASSPAVAELAEHSVVEEKEEAREATVEQDVAALLAEEPAAAEAPAVGPPAAVEAAASAEERPTEEPAAAQEASGEFVARPWPTALVEVAPALVRGYSGAGDDEQSLGNLVASVLPGWSGVDRGAIVVEEVSGEGAQTTHRISAPVAVPPCVAFHKWAEEGPDEICLQRTAAAARLFAQHSLAPPRLAEGGDWYIEPWEGSGHPELDASRMAEVGELVARVHRLPTDWFDGFRERLRERMPDLRRVPAGSHVWWWSSREELMDELTEECRRLWCDVDYFAPASAPGKRIVTIHADLHPENMLETDDGLLLIDFEYACVTHAVHDLAFAINMCCDEDPKRKWALIEAYLKASDYPAGESEIEALLFDCEVAFLGTHVGPLELWIGHDSPEKWLERVHAYKPFVIEARGRPDLRQRILEKGIVEYLRENRTFCTPGVPVVLCDRPETANGRLILNEDGTISPEALRGVVAIGVPGVGCIGPLVVVPRIDARLRIAFRLRPLQLAAEASAGNAPGVGAGCDVPFLLEAADRPGGLFLTTLPGQPPRLVRCVAVMQPLALGPLQCAIPFVRRGMYFVRAQLPGAAPASVGFCNSWSAIYLGDVDKDLARTHAMEMYDYVRHNEVEKLRALLAQGADANLPQEEGDSLGHIACREDHVEILQVLLAHGFNPNTGDAYVGSPLIEAATYGHVECVKLLLTVEDIDLGVKEEGKTAVEWARDPDPHDKFSDGHAEVIAMIEATAKARVCQLFCGAQKQPG